MKLVEVQITKFRNILDSELVQIQSDVTCLVGKNESGKTAFLHALYRLLPARGNVAFSVHDQYPAWLEKRDRLRGINLDDVRPVQATFQLDGADMAAVADALGKEILSSDKLHLERSYDGTLYHKVDIDESAAVRHLVDSLDLPDAQAERAGSVGSLAGLRELATELSGTADDEDAVNAGAVLASKIQEVYGTESVSKAVWDVLKPRVPKFFYFHEYSTLPYTVGIQRVLQGADKELTDGELTARSLLRMAAAADEYLLNPDYERRKRELENVANALTNDVLKYWSQNPELRVLPDIERATPQGQPGPDADELKIRIWDNRHQLSLPFEEHSSGFRWFFSFLAAFSEYEFAETPVVILLDEPALGLHARAQADFLRFIDERLSKRHQVIYTTHSSFMIQPGKLERVRMVEDKDRENGAKIWADIMSTDRDTLFPLQGALGYDLAQHLFIAPHNLVVEGTSDYTYLRVISDFFAEHGDREPLDERWSMVPVGGVDLVPTFVALLGQHLDITVVIDARRKGHQRLSQLAAQGYLAEKRIITIGQVLGKRSADIEDLFSPGDYLGLYNKAFGTSHKVADLTGTDPIVHQLARLDGIDRFDHGKPADVLLRDRTSILPNFSKQTFDNFESLFRAVNKTLAQE
ncbi:MAG: AAA family ATPase [Deltaproteobacteria bacterium]|nr:AAA family ATPase [Deltaproteobacteria bacterium]